MARGLAVVVEDSLPFAEMLRSYLEALGGFAISVCGTAGEARTILSRHRPALLILDIDLPDGSGVDVCRAARGHLSSTTILIVTANADMATLRSCIEAGADDFIEKSADVARVFERVKYWAVARRGPLDARRRQPLVSAIAAKAAAAPDSDPFDDNCALLAGFLRAARAQAVIPTGVTPTLRQRLFLLGYANGAVQALASVDMRVRVKADAHLSYVLLDANLASPVECPELVATIAELYEADRFRAGNEQGHADMLGYIQKNAPPAGLRAL